MDLGLWNRLRIDRFTSIGAYLVDEKGNDVLLPGKCLSDDALIDDMVEVYLYKDSEDRLIATTMEPIIQLGEFGYLKVNEVSMYGAFLEWGIEKDLLVPHREQPKAMEEGRYYLVYLYLDDATQRLAATARIDKYLEPADDSVKAGDEVEILICDATELGVKVIVSHKFRGMIFRSDIHRKLIPGQVYDGFVKNIREDGKIDITLVKDGYGKVEPLTQEILTLLERNNGFIPLTDKSQPERIQEFTKMSKKTFKQVVGNLYKQRLVTISEDGITLIKNV